MCVVKPARSPPHGSLMKPRNSTGRVTVLVTPCMVNVPVTSYTSFLPDALMLVLLKLISGNFSTSKKFAPRRSLSRLSLPVSIEVVLILNSTEDAAGFARSTLIAPLKSSNLPLTRLTRWRLLDHARRDFQRGQTGGTGAAQDAQDVVLLCGDAVGADDGAEVAAEDVGSAQKRACRLLLFRGERLLLLDLVDDGHGNGRTI